MSVRLVGGPCEGNLVEWDAEMPTVYVEHGWDDPGGERVSGPYVKINAHEAIYKGVEAPDPRHD